MFVLDGALNRYLRNSFLWDNSHLGAIKAQNLMNNPRDNEALVPCLALIIRETRGRRGGIGAERRLPKRSGRRAPDVDGEDRAARAVGTGAPCPSLGPGQQMATKLSRSSPPPAQHTHPPKDPYTPLIHPLTFSLSASFVCSLKGLLESNTKRSFRLLPGLQNVAIT